MSAPKRRLEDLYVVGKEVTFDDGRGEAVTVWLQKLNPVELNTALRRANAARSRVKSVRSDQDCDEYRDYWLEVQDFERKEDLVDYLSGEGILRIQDREEAKLAATDEWSKDGYIQGLRDAWVDGLSDRHLIEPDEESERVWAEVQRFAAEAEVNAQPDIEAMRAEHAAKDMDLLREEAMERVLAYHANAAWLEEFHRCELWKGVRDPKNRKAYYFDSRDQIDNLSAMVLNRLISEYSALSVDVTEGKDSEETPSSSNSSAPVDEAATAVSSGLVAVGQ